MTNDIQKAIILSIVENSKDMHECITNMKATFPVNTLCEMFEINRNRYNYMKRTKSLDYWLSALINKVVKENETK